MDQMPIPGHRVTEPCHYDDHRGPHVAIIGGGASGVLMAAQLLSQPKARFRVTIIEGRNMLGCGIAYSTTDPDHLLNTRVENMSAFPDQPDHFRRWLMSTDAAASGTSFVSRGTYGAYLSELLVPWQSGNRLRCLRHRCVGIDDHGKDVVLRMDDGSLLRADQVILATGHILPQPEPESPLSGAWNPLDCDPDRRVIIIGTGLSMVDQVLSLVKRGHRGEIVALSRRGLLPREHGPVTPRPMDHQIDAGLPVSALLRQIRALAAEATRRGGSWRDAIDGVRPQVSRLWGAMTLDQRARFLRHAAPWWDVHRHRMPPVSAHAVTAAVARGQLHLLRGGFIDAHREGDSIIARVKPHGAGPSQEIPAARIIDCRGIRLDPLRHGPPLYRDLLRKGLAGIDPLQIGLTVSPDCTVIGTDGTPSPRLHAIGPVSRAAFWEITAIPDIREQAAVLARRMAEKQLACTAENRSACGETGAA